MLLALAAAAAFGLVAYRLRALDASGAVAGAVLAAAILWLGGWRWAVPGVGFFVLSSLLSKPGKRRVARLEAVSQKGSRRDAGQVIANGGVAGLCLAGHALAPSPLWLWGYLGAFAAATADTWATEVGTLVGGTPRLVTTLRKVPPGMSGAVSAAGLLAAVAGAGVIWALAALVFGEMATVRAAAVITGSGFAAALVDSLLGATVQARYRDARTGEFTERPVTDGCANALEKGHRALDNDRVNLLCTLAGALLALVLAQVAGYL